MLGQVPTYSFSTAANDTGLFNFRGIRRSITAHGIFASNTPITIWFQSTKSSTPRRCLLSWHCIDREEENEDAV